MKNQLTLALLGSALISGATLAQNVPGPGSNAPATSSQRTESNAQKTVMLKQGEWRGSKLTGLAVYNNNDERVGEINELIIGKDGKIESVVLGVGGISWELVSTMLPCHSVKVKFVEELAAAPERTAARTDERSRNEAAWGTERRGRTNGCEPDRTNECTGSRYTAKGPCTGDDCHHHSHSPVTMGIAAILTTLSSA